MSKLAYHADHFKSGNIRGIAMHNWEKRGEHDNHSNQDIDPSRSHLNVQLVDQETTLYRSIKKDIEERCTGRITKASNWMSETIVYPPDNILDDREQCIRFFNDVLDWHKKEFGEKNVKSSVVHFDETTPHLHTDLIPLTKDGRLSAKEIFARKNLNRHHTELAKHLQERGWDIQRGEPAPDKKERKALTVKEYKRAAEITRADLQKEIKDKQTELKDLDKNIDDLMLEHNQLVKKHNELIGDHKELVDDYNELAGEHQQLSKDVQELRNIKDKADKIDSLEVKIKGFGSNKHVEVPLEDWEHVYKVYKKNPALERENYEVRSGNNRLTQENHRLNSRNQQISDENKQLREEVKELRPLRDYLQINNLLEKAKQWYQELQRKAKDKYKSKEQER